MFALRASRIVILERSVRGDMYFSLTSVGVVTQRVGCVILRGSPLTGFLLYTSFELQVIVQEGGFIWYRPPSKIFSGRHAQAQEVPTRIEFRAEYFRSSSPPISPTTATDSGCAEDRALCASNATRYHAHCLRCSNTSSFNLTIAVKRARKYPIVGFGGHMIAFDGGDDFFVVNYSELPQYEFGIQFNKT